MKVKIHGQRFGGYHALRKIVANARVAEAGVESLLVRCQVAQVICICRFGLGMTAPQARDVVARMLDQDVSESVVKCLMTQGLHMLREIEEFCHGDQAVGATNDEQPVVGNALHCRRRRAARPVR